jgi:hypothetical protein
MFNSHLRATALSFGQSILLLVQIPCSFEVETCVCPMEGCKKYTKFYIHGRMQKFSLIL